MNKLIETTVRATRDECPGVRSFELVPSDSSKRLPPFEAGAHVDVHLPNGLIRQYSLLTPADTGDGYLIGVLQVPDSRGGSSAMHAVGVGQTLMISEPRNHFPLVRDARRSVLFAGGIGITPILCMAEEFAAKGENFELHYCTRSSALTAFRDRLLSSVLAERVTFHFDDGPPEQKLDIVTALGSPGSHSHVYVCGPNGFMDWVLTSARAQGWADTSLHMEHFSAPAHAADPDAERAFKVIIASTGDTYDIPPDRSVVKVLEEHGIVIPVSCEQGVCGTCLTRVREGQPDHRDLFLTAQERAANNQFTPCCSRSCSDVLVLDL